MRVVLLRCDRLVAGWQAPASQALSLAIGPGEVVGLTGPNGVGKSTVLAALAGRARIFSGQVERLPGLQVALHTQELPALAGLPIAGADLLALTGATSAGLPAWLTGRLHQRLDALSGGQRHYLALWAILQAPADLLLLDEPTNHLDVAGVEHLAGVLRAKAAQGVGILLVSHDHAFVERCCDRIEHLDAVHAV